MQGDDLEAIHRYMMTAETQTPEAVALRDGWIVWWEDLNWWEKNTDDDTYNQARNRRNAFLRANAVTPDEKAAAEAVILGGVTTEEMAGGVRETNSQGGYAEERGLGTTAMIGLYAGGLLLAAVAIRQLFK